MARAFRAHARTQALHARPLTPPAPPARVQASHKARLKLKMKAVAQVTARIANSIQVRQHAVFPQLHESRVMVVVLSIRGLLRASQVAAQIAAQAAAAPTCPKIDSAERGQPAETAAMQAQEARCLA